IGVPLTQALNDASFQEVFEDPVSRALIRHPEVWEKLAQEEVEEAIKLIKQYKSGGDRDPDLDALLKQLEESPGATDGSAGAAPEARDGAGKPDELKVAPKVVPPVPKSIMNAQQKVRVARRSLGGGLKGLVVPATKLRRARLPFPPSQIVEIYG